MSKRKPNQLAEGELAKALAALIKNTRTTSRHNSLPEIAESLDTAIAGLGTVQEVANRIGLSSKMLRQFMAIKELTPDVQELFSDRKLDSVDLAVHLRMLSPEEQLHVAKESAAGDLNTADVRAICEYRKQHADSEIADVVAKVKATRNIKQYVIEFVVRGPNVGEHELRSRIDFALGAENVDSLQLEGSIGNLVINQQGRSRVQAIAREQSISQAEAIDKIVTGEWTE